MFPSCRNKEHHCFHVMANLGPTVGLACWLGVSMSPQAPGEEQRPDRGQGSATSLRNTNQAKICSLPKLAEVFPNPVVSSSVLVRFQCVWLDKEQHWGQPWAATAWNCFSEVLSRSMHALCSWPDSGADPTNPTLLFSLAGAAGDQGLPRLCPGSDRAAGGSIHHVHSPGSTSDFYKEETEEGTSFNCCMKADSWIWEDLTPVISDWALLEDSSNHYL